MSQRTCSVDGCERPHEAKSFCEMHYDRWRKWGDPLRTSAGYVGVASTQQPTGLSTAERFWAKVDKDGPVPQHVPHLGKCWVWAASLNGNGYGQFWMPEVQRMPMIASRVSWVLHFGAIPDATPFVLHRCDNPPCVRPSHLRLGDHARNMLDMAERERRNIEGLQAWWSAQAAKTECPYGHPYDEANTYVHPTTGARSCRRCKADSEQRRRDRLRLSTPEPGL
jgi:hypothetical protein